MIYEERTAPPELEGIVSRLWVLETTPLRRFEKILPQPSAHLIVNLSTPYRLFDRRGQATPVSRPVEVHYGATPSRKASKPARSSPIVQTSTTWPSRRWKT